VQSGPIPDVADHVPAAKGGSKARPGMGWARAGAKAKEASTKVAAASLLVEGFIRF
jgi:hypothetical protein